MNSHFFQVLSSFAILYIKGSLLAFGGDGECAARGDCVDPGPDAILGEGGLITGWEGFLEFTSNTFTSGTES